jgi:DNA-binding NarL/FixJ family response regulator
LVVEEGVTVASRGSGARIVGREPELAAVREFFGARSSLPAFVLTGGAGIGKTTLWEVAVDVARERELRVLLARPSGAEAQLSFATLIDLFDGVDTDELAALPAPQLHTLRVALLRAEPRGVAAEPHAIAVGLLSALRALAARAPLLVAVDDIQWLDSPSADALAFAARRLEGDAVRFLLARRPGSTSALEQALESKGLERLEVVPLSLGAIRRLLSERLGLSLPRQLLRRIFESTLGNPLFALELGRALAERGSPEIGEDIPVPDAVEDLLGTRVARLPGPERRLLLAVALSADLRTTQLAAIADPVALDAAADAGLLIVEGDRVRPSHPLLAAAAKRHSRAGARRELHHELASVVADGELRARHLALATVHPDSELAATVAVAAAGASARGARQEAVELAEHALRLTPAEEAERSERLLVLAGYLEAAGEPQRVTDLLTPELDSLPPGAARVKAQLLLSEGGGVSSIWDHERHLERALAESQGDPVLRARVLAKMSSNAAATAVSRIRLAETWALEALPAARRAGPELERLVLYGLGWAQSLRGHPVDDLCERFRRVSRTAYWIAESPEHVAGQRLGWRGDVRGARTTLTRLRSLADEQGEEMSYALVGVFLCDVELRAGNWEAVARLLDEWAESERLLVAPTYLRIRAQVAAGRGLPDEAERWAEPAIAGAEAIGTRWQLLEALRAHGIAALLAHEPGRTVESLRAVWEYAEREGVKDPGAFPVAPDLVEALVELSRVDEARTVTARLTELAEQQEHPWGRVTALRCRALIQLASQTDQDEAASALADASVAYERLGLRFDQARSLLILGRAQRRRRKWAAARIALEQAAAAFDEIGSSGWSDQARGELARVGARRAAPAGELTPAQRRVVELAAEGLSNKEIARALFVTVHTVEVHLSHAYGKLGVRSRSQLAGRLSGRT